MNAVRAPALLPTPGPPLSPAADWPHAGSGVAFDRVVGVALDSRGAIYAAHRGDRPLLKFAADGVLAAEIGAADHRRTTAYDLRGPVPIPIAPRTWLHGLSVDPWDNIWVTDVGRHLVMKFDRAGRLVLTLGVDGESGCDERRFNQPTHVCVVPSGEIFVTDGYGNSRVIKFDARGNYLAQWGSRGTAPGQFHSPHVIVLGPEGRLCVSDRENDRLQIFEQDGALVSVWPDFHSVDGLCAGADGFLYGSSGIDHALVQWDWSGRLRAVWTVPGALIYPHAVARDASGALLAADTGDVWVCTGRRPEERSLLPRAGSEGSALIKFLPPAAASGRPTGPPSAH